MAGYNPQGLNLQKNWEIESFANKATDSRLVKSKGKRRKSSVVKYIVG